jgi:hypothetical protein
MRVSASMAARCGVLARHACSGGTQRLAIVGRVARVDDGATAMTDAARRKGPIPLRVNAAGLTPMQRTILVALKRERQHPKLRISYGALALMQLIGSALSLGLGLYLGRM